MTHPNKRGWYCLLHPEHDGPCPMYPRWWNSVLRYLTGRWIF